jgi:uncharacterized protein (TIGR03435 family)
MRAAYILCPVLLCGTAFGQATEPPPKFEAADVHVNPATRNPFFRGAFHRSGRYELRMASMVDLVAAAYGVDSENVQGGPNWLEMDRFDVVAKPAAKSTPESLKTMLQQLLAERFQLAVHKESKAMPAYALTAGKHPALKKASESGKTGCNFTVDPPAPPPPGQGPFIPMLLYTCRNMTMTAFAEGMRNMPVASQYLNSNPVVDKTDLQGAWDFDFKYSVRGPAASGALITLFDAIDKQLGLKLELVKVPRDVIVVDSVNRKPSANPAGTLDVLQLTEPPTEFEVAEIKPSDPEFRGVRFQVQPGGRLNLAGVTLKLIIQQAWNISDDMLIGAPKWLDEDRYDIIAKAPATALPSTDPSAAPAGNRNGPPIDIDALFVMLRALVKERFKLETHMEDRPVSAYNLVALKPKLKKADPASRTKFSEGPAADAKDPRNANPALARLVTVQNMTMAQFAAQLQNIAPGYIRSPVLDATALEGSWDFTMNFSPAGLLQAGPGGRGGRGGDGPVPAPEPQGGTATASDPTGGMTLFDAIEKQLGLKLELQKRPVPVLVIDHIERKPIE